MKKSERRQEAQQIEVQPGHAQNSFVAKLFEVIKSFRDNANVCKKTEDTYNKFYKRYSIVNFSDNFSSKGMGEITIYLINYEA